MALDFLKDIQNFFTSAMKSDNSQFAVNDLDPNNVKSQINIAAKGIQNNKTFTLRNPRSERFTLSKEIQSANKDRFKNWKPTGESLSPNGWMQERELQKLERENPGLKDVPVRETSIPSTCLRTIKYNPEMESLTVQFQGKNSKKYWYPGVPSSIVMSLMKAPSKGSFFLHNIHDQYTQNPGHRPSGNKFNQSRISTSYGARKAVWNISHKLNNMLGLRAQEDLKRAMNNPGTGKTSGTVD